MSTASSSLVRRSASTQSAVGVERRAPFAHRPRSLEVCHAQAKAASAEADRSLRVKRLPAGEHRDEALNPLGARLWACGLVDAQ